MNLSARFTPRFSARRIGRVSIAMLAVAFAASAGAQVTLLHDDFDGSALDDSKWATGRTTGNPTFDVSAGSLTVAMNQTNNGWAPIISNAHSFNPFADTHTLSMKGIELDGVGIGATSASLYAAIGRARTTDSGGAMDSGTNQYTTDSYTSGLTLQVLHYAGESNTWRMQVQDRATGVVDVNNITFLSGAPTDIDWVIDGATNSYQILLTGATFQDGSRVLGGTFEHFSLAGITTDEGDIVSRVAFGVRNNNGVAAPGATASFDSVSVVSAVPEPSTYAMFASAVIGGFVIVRRARKNRD